MSRVIYVALSIEILLLRYIFMVARMSEYDDALPYNLLFASCCDSNLADFGFNNRSAATSFTYVTFCEFGIVWGLMKNIMFVPVVILDQTHCASCPK